MDMPITVPRASVTQSADDLKARDMVLCRFPEVDMVVGKAGRAETPTDPAPMDMIETMVNFRPREFWPRRKLLAPTPTPGPPDARRLVAGGPDPPRARSRSAARRDARGSWPRSCPGSTPRCANMPTSATREFVRERGAELGATSHDGLTPRAAGPLARARPGARRRAARPRRRGLHPAGDRGPAGPDCGATDPEVAAALAEVRRHRETPPAPVAAGRGPSPSAWAGRPRPPTSPPIPRLDAVQDGARDGVRPAARALAEGAGRAGRLRLASSTGRCRCRAGRTSGRCRSRTASTCSPPA